MNRESSLQETDQAYWRLEVNAPRHVSEGFEFTMGADNVSGTEIIRRAVGYYHGAADAILIRHGFVSAELAQTISDDLIDLEVGLDEYITRCLRFYDKVREKFELGYRVSMNYPDLTSRYLRNFEDNTGEPARRRRRWSGFRIPGLPRS